jgi:predicted amidohydrolase
MSKLMLLGMSLEDVLARSTVNPAKAIGRYPEVGTLGVGRVADIAMLEQKSGVFVFKDSWPAKRLGTRRLESVMTIRAGKIVYARGEPAAASQDTTVYDLLFKHAQIAGRSEEYDIAIIGNRIARIGHGLKAAHARVLVEAEGYIVKLAGLAEGAPANVAVLDAGRTVMTVSNGRIVTDDEGLSIPDVSRAGPYSNFK